MNSFTSRTYYITKPGNTKQITNIAFYDKNGGIKTSIDMAYNPDGSLKPFTVSYKNGVPKTEGTHMHNWPRNGQGDYGRVSHDPKNIKPVNRYYMRFVNKALKYNTKHVVKKLRK